MFAVYKRDLRAFYTTPIGYVFSGVLILIMNLCFYFMNVEKSSSNVKPIFYLLLIGLAFLAPILTMRLLSEEKKLKTDQLLFTVPIRMTDIVLGKYFAALSVFVLSMLGTFMIPLILKFYSVSEPWAIFGNYVAIFFAASAFIAIGLFISSLTENQGFAAGIGVYSSYIGMKIYQESSDHLLESFSQISETFTLFVQRNWTVLSQWDGLLKNADIDHADSIWPDMQSSKASWRYSDFYLVNESTQYLTADGRKGSADSISGVIQELYSEDGPIVSTYTASYGVPKIVFAMPLSRDITLDGVTYTGLAVSYDTDVVDDLVDGSMYGGQSDCYIVRANGDIVLALEPQTELCKGLTNLFDLDARAEWKYGSMDDIRDCVQLGRSGSAQFICQGGRNYLVAIPTAFPDWTLVGIIRADEVDGAMLSVQQSTIIALGALCIFAVIIVVLALGMESQLRLRREEEERLNLEREKMKSDRFLQSMSRIVDRYSIVNLDTDRYRYRELRNSEPLYPSSGRYSDMVETISSRYVALTETENAKLSRLITPEYLRSVLRKPDDNLKIEYCSRTENAYMVLTVIPVEWHADGTVYEVMQVVQDIGQKIELENMANTDSMTGLFNERYFSRVLNICEEKKLPFVLYYLDLDRFKPINDTYGHLMGDRLLKEIAARLLRCIRSRDYAFRIGGDEFALIVSADMDEGQRARMAERIQTTLSAPVVLDGKELSVGVSCGCACYPEDGSASQVRIAADSRMYATKQRHHENDRTEGEL